MILQSLAALSSALTRADPDNFPMPGYRFQRVGYIVELDRAGAVTDVFDLTGEIRSVQLPANPKSRTSGIVADLMWGNPEYALGLGNRADTPKRFEAFRKAVADLPEDVRADPGVDALLTFLNAHNPTEFAASRFGSLIADPAQQITFQLRGEDDLICQCEAVRHYVASLLTAGKSVTCLVTGRKGSLAQTHSRFPGIPNGATAGATLVSFNFPSAEYYGRDQGENAPISAETKATYESALRYALDRSHGLRFRLLDNVMLGWSNTRKLVLPVIGDLLDTETAGEAGTADRAIQVFRAPSDTGLTQKDLDADYYVLGLTGVQARIAVSFFQHGRLGDLVANVIRWFDDLSIAGRPSFAKSHGCRIFDLVLALAPPKREGGVIRKDLDRLSGRRQTELLFAALNGTPVSVYFATQALLRLRVGGFAEHEHTLTMLVKLHLNRNLNKGLTMALDESRTDIGYLLGRQFAVIERAQQASTERDVNTTLRDKYWSGASTYPTRTFPVLAKLFFAYAKRSERVGWLEREYHGIASLIDPSAVTPRLNLEQQMLFALGYSQERTKLWTRRDSTVTESPTSETVNG